MDEVQLIPAKYKRVVGDERLSLLLQRKKRMESLPINFIEMI